MAYGVGSFTDDPYSCADIFAEIYRAVALPNGCNDGMMKLIRGTS